MRKITVLVITVLLASTVAACTPAQKAWCLADRERCTAAIAAMNSHAAWRAQQSRPSATCYEAIDRHWPAATAEWFKGVVWRESRNIPTAANSSSSARGCAQLLMSLHSHRYTAVGCSPTQWANPDCNIRAALHLYREAGASPWALTA